MALESYDSFEAVKSRLEEIVDAVSSDELELDAALALYEEAGERSAESSDEASAQETGAPVSA